jgi:hypothetical protein
MNFNRSIVYFAKLIQQHEPQFSERVRLPAVPKGWVGNMSMPVPDVAIRKDQVRPEELVRQGTWLHLMR